MDRKQALRRLVQNQGLGLEIGPSHAPVFARADGFNVETLDHADATTLRRKYADIGVDVSAIEEVTFVSDGRPLHEVIPRRGVYDYIFSSHVIEHVTDIVSYFESCELLLKPTGIAALAIPDKRYTFDFMQPYSTTGQALEAHYRSTGRHSPAAIFDFNANSCLLAQNGVWSRFDQGEFSFVNTPQFAKSAFDQSILADCAYQDVHGWYFTPNSFRMLMHDLKELGLIDLREIYMMEHDSLEFHVAYSRDHIGNGLTRLQIQQNVIAEQVVAGMQALASGDPKYSSLFQQAMTCDTHAQPATAPLVVEPAVIAPKVRPSLLRRMSQVF